MKRRDDDKDMLCSSPSKLDPIPLDIKLTRLPAKFRMKTHKVIDEKEERSPIKVDDDPIPLDLEVAILTRLPPKSVIKFLCVSKMRSSIIPSQRFVNAYYAMSSTMRSRFIITFSGSELDKRCVFVFSSSYESEISSSLATNLEMTIPSLTGLCGAGYCASVHGLIGFFMGGGPFIVCNPSTNKFTTLPCAATWTSWAYVPVGDQFKTLTMVSYPPYRPRDFNVHKVLTLGGGGGESKKLTTPHYFTVTKSVCINGFVYSGAWTETETAPFMEAFGQFSYRVVENSLLTSATLVSG